MFLIIKRKKMPILKIIFFLNILSNHWLFPSNAIAEQSYKQSIILEIKSNEASTIALYYSIYNYAYE